MFQLLSFGGSSNAIASRRPGAARHDLLLQAMVWGDLQEISGIIRSMYGHQQIKCLSRSLRLCWPYPGPWGPTRLKSPCSFPNAFPALTPGSELDPLLRKLIAVTEPTSHRVVRKGIPAAIAGPCTHYSRPVGSKLPHELSNLTLRKTNDVAKSVTSTTQALTACSLLIWTDNY